MHQDGIYARERCKIYLTEGAKSSECIEVMGPLCYVVSTGAVLARETGLICGGGGHRLKKVGR